MKFTFITLFKELIDGYFSNSIINRAINNGIVKIEYINPREHTNDKHKKVDAPLVGGGAGMLLQVEPIFEALKSIADAHIIFLTPSAKKFDQKDAIRLSKKDHVVLVSGRYDGFDERLIENCADEVFSVGDFILTGGEIPSLILCDAICRNINGVLGNSESTNNESFFSNKLEAPKFAKPKYFKKNGIPPILFSGNHAKILKLESTLSLCKTKYYRPDLVKGMKNEK